MLSYAHWRALDLAAHFHARGEEVAYVYVCGHTDEYSDEVREGEYDAYQQCLRSSIPDRWEMEESKDTWINEAPPTMRDWS